MTEIATQMSTTPLHNLLPPDAQATLMRAAATPTPEDDPMARIRAIDRAILRVRRTYPGRFNTEQAFTYEIPHL